MRKKREERDYLLFLLFCRSRRVGFFFWVGLGGGGVFWGGRDLIAYFVV